MSDKTAYCYDSEFLEDGRMIELISIGIVSGSGREYYAVNSEMPLERILANDWLVRNVVPSLPITGRASLDTYLAHPRNTFPKPGLYVDLDTKSTVVKPRWVIANEVRDFLLADGPPELWADYGAYDHIVLCQLWGPMISLPEGIPMFTHDIEQAIEAVPGFEKPQQTAGEHNALEDARHNLRVLAALRAAKASV